MSERGRIEATLSDVADYMEQHPNCKGYPLDLAVVQSAAEITDVPELHDRLIAGTARLLDVELITTDSAIEASRVVRTAAAVSSHEVSMARMVLLACSIGDVTITFGR